jgi:hypothetical protein
MLKHLTLLPSKKVTAVLVYTIQLYNNFTFKTPKGVKNVDYISIILCKNTNVKRELQKVAPTYTKSYFFDVC